MRIQPIRNNNSANDKYREVSHKAYFKKNKNLADMINNSTLGKESIKLADKILSKLPDHELEVVAYEIRDTNENLYNAKILNHETGKMKDICLFADEKAKHFSAVLYNLVTSGNGYWIKSSKKEFYSKITKKG